MSICLRATSGLSRSNAVEKLTTMVRDSSPNLFPQQLTPAKSYFAPLQTEPLHHPEPPFTGRVATRPRGIPPAMFGVLEAISVPHNGIYNTYEDLFRDLSERVGKDGYKIVKARSHRSRINGQLGADMVRCDLVCDRGGRPYKSMATKHKTTTKKTGCPWNAKAVHRKTIGGWVLTIACDQHNHEPGTPEPPTPSDVSEAEDNDNDPEGEDAEGKQTNNAVLV